MSRKTPIKDKPPEWAKQLFIDIGDIKNQLKELGVVKKSLEFIDENIGKIQDRQNKEEKVVDNLLQKMEQLEKDNRIKTQKILELQNKVDELEQYTRKNNIVISGFETKSFSEIVSGHNDIPMSGNLENDVEVMRNSETLETKVIDMFKTKVKVDVVPSDISAIHYLPSKNNSNKKEPKSILVHFVNRKTKEKLLKNGKNLKNTEIYLNEHLTKRNADIHKKARMLKKEKKIIGTWTRNCKIYVKVDDGSLNGKIIGMNTMEDFEKLNIDY